MLQLEDYLQHEQHLPSSGNFIIAQFDHKSIIIYQAFKDSIARYAVEHQQFGGPDYDFLRMTWLKPSFLWMMHYSDWGGKESQENVLAIKMNREGFDELLNLAVTTTYDSNIYPDKASWEKELRQSEVQLQWEPYHNLLGDPTERRAVKIGLKASLLSRYNNEWIEEIENITPYVKKLRQLLLGGYTEQIQLPHERAYAPDNLSVLGKIDATTISL